MTVGEIAKKLNVSPSTVRKWTISGRISATTTDGGHRRYVYEDVLTALDLENPDLKKKCLIYINIKNLKESSKYMEMAIFHAKSSDWKIIKTIGDYTGKLDSAHDLFEEVIKLIITDKVNRIILPYKSLLGMRGKQQLIEIMCKVKRIKIIYLENELNRITNDDIDEINKIKNEALAQYKEK
jgi:excisionase family DNA binding protein